MYDASTGFTYEDALYLGHVLEDQNYYWYEEPLDHLNLTALARLTAAGLMAVQQQLLLARN